MVEQRGRRDARQPAPRPADARVRDSARTRTELLDVATAEFAEHGFSGARVDRIAERTQTTKRMIYYYFGGKEELYLAVLERAYGRIRRLEQQVDVDHLEPLDALRTLVESTFDSHVANPDFVRLVSIENIHRAQHLREARDRTTFGTPALGVLERIVRRGQQRGHVRPDIQPLELHALISALCTFPTANRWTFAAVFDHDLLAADSRAHLRRTVGDAVIAYAAADSAR